MAFSECLTSVLQSATKLEFNSDKSSCAVIGPAARINIDNMILGNVRLSWTSMIKYLGISFQVGRKMVIDTAIIKRKFYVSVNCILGKSRCTHETVKLALMEAHCLPVLLYSCAALSYTNQQLRDINACWNSVYRRIFGFNKWDSVRAFIAGLGRMDFMSIHAHLCLKFYKGGSSSNNSIFSNTVNRFMFSNDFKLLCNSVSVTLEVNYLLAISYFELKSLLYTNFCNRASNSK